MGAIANAFSAAFRDFNTDGVSTSGVHQPVKSDIRMLGSTIETYATVEPQRSVMTAADLPIRATDVRLNYNATTDLATQLPLAASRAGAKLVLKIMPTCAPQTFLRSGGDSIDGQTSIGPLSPGTYTLTPYNDAVNGNMWAI